MFNFKNTQNLVNENFSADLKLEGFPVLNFTLAPLNAETNFLIRQFQRLANTPDVDRALFRIGASRVCGWSGVKDKETGEDIPFNAETYTAFYNMYEAVPYFVLIGEHTLDSQIISKVNDETKEPVEGEHQEPNH